MLKQVEWKNRFRFHSSHFDYNIASIAMADFVTILGERKLFPFLKDHCFLDIKAIILGNASFNCRHVEIHF